MEPGQCVNGQRGFRDEDPCPTCGRPKAPLKCGRCRAVRYCDRQCQKLHWGHHKRHCHIAADQSWKWVVAGVSPVDCFFCLFFIHPSVLSSAREVRTSVTPANISNLSKLRNNRPSSRADSPWMGDGQNRETVTTPILYPWPLVVTAAGS